MDLTPYLFILQILAIVGLWISLSTEQSQIVAKTRGAFAGKIATGYMKAMQIMILNRFGTIVYMISLSLCIDIGVENKTLLLVSILSGLLVLGYNIFLIVGRRQVLNFPDGLPFEKLTTFMVGEDKWYFLASYFATLLNVLGLTLPLLLSNSIPEYRLTLANSGFLLNIFFTMINVLILERRYASILDNETQAGAYLFVVRIFVARSFALISAILIFTLLYYFSIDIAQ